MARQPKSQDETAVADALREAFKVIEARPVPLALTGHLDQLAAPKRRPDGRS
jgi:hypothetical protein